MKASHRSNLASSCLVFFIVHGFLISWFFIGFASKSTAQCSPDLTATTIGITPDSVCLSLDTQEIYLTLPVY